MDKISCEVASPQRMKVHCVRPLNNLHRGRRKYDDESLCTIAVDNYTEVKKKLTTCTEVSLNVMFLSLFDYLFVCFSWFYYAPSRYRLYRPKKGYICENVNENYGLMKHTLNC